MPANTSMSFARIGRSCHLRIETGDDLQRAVELDESHWVATSAPLDALYCDQTFLAMLDSDSKGRVTCHELTDAISWLLTMLTDTSQIGPEGSTLKLSSVNAESPDGKNILAAARSILQRLGKGDSETITLDEIRKVKSAEQAKPISSSGVVLPQACDDEDLSQFITDIITTCGGADHPSGAKGVDESQLSAFLSGSAAFLQWQTNGQIGGDAESTETMPLGSGTVAAFATLSQLRDKIDQFYAQCRALQLDESLAGRMGLSDAELQEHDLDDPAAIDEVLKISPIAQADKSGVLNFSGKLNPYYSDMVARLGEQVIAPVLGTSPDMLTAAQWSQVKAHFAGYEAWMASKPGDATAALGEDTLRKYQDARYGDKVRELITAKGTVALVLGNISLLEKLVLYQANMIEFANNFVSFPHVYDPDTRAMFDMGGLVMDGRRFNLAVKVLNRATHARLAKTSNMFVIYVSLTPRLSVKTVMEVVVPVTSGGKGNLCIGKRGVFYDADGMEYDAEVVSLIENPISIVEAIKSPFVKLGRLLSGKIESLASKAETRLDTQAGSALNDVTERPGGAKATGAATGGMMMGAGVAVAALGSAFAYISKTIGETPWSQLFMGLGVAILLVVLPIAIIGLLKLRKRDLSPLLEGSGWAINARMRLTRKQARYFTDTPAYPRGAQGVRRFPWAIAIILGIVVVAMAAGQLYMVHKDRQSKQDAQATTQPAKK